LPDTGFLHGADAKSDKAAIHAFYANEADILGCDAEMR
jgi:hypothetical protein